MIKKEDLRVQKTKIALAQALISLLKSHSFKKITVNDICQGALVSRSAFYVHFEDKYQLLQFCLTGIKEETARECDGLPAKERILVLLRTIQSHANIFRNLMVEDLDSEVAEMLWQSFLADFQESDYQAKHHPGAGSSPVHDAPPAASASPPIPAELASVYYGAGISSVITLWIIKDLPYTAEEIAQHLYQLLAHIIKEDDES